VQSESPQSGEYWTSRDVIFNKLKLTNSKTCRDPSTVSIESLTDVDFLQASLFIVFVIFSLFTLKCFGLFPPPKCFVCTAEYYFYQLVFKNISPLPSSPWAPYHNYWGSRPAILRVSGSLYSKTVAHLGMHDEIFHFEIFINFMEILKYFNFQDNFFEIFHEIFNFHYKVT